MHPTLSDASIKTEAESAVASNSSELINLEETTAATSSSNVLIKSEYFVDTTNNSTTNLNQALKRKLISSDSLIESTNTTFDATKNSTDPTSLAPPPPPTPPKSFKLSNANTENSSQVAAENVNGNDEEVAALEQLFLNEELDTRARQTLLQNTTEQLKKKICILKLKQLNEIRHECIDNLSEQFYLGEFVCC